MTTAPPSPVPPRPFETFVDTVDVAVHDLDAAAAYVGDLLGIPASPPAVTPDPVDGQGVHGIELAVGGLRRVRLVSPVDPARGQLAEHLRTHGEGVWSVRLLVDGLADRVAALRDARVDVHLVGDRDGERSLAATDAGSSDGTRFVLVEPAGGIPTGLDVHVPADAGARGVERAYVLVWAVPTLAAAPRMRALVGLDGVPMAAGMEPSGTLDGIHFPTGGIYNLGLLAPRGAPRGQIALAASEALDRRGAGPFLFGFQVSDLDVALARLAAHDHELAGDPVRYAIGRQILTVRRHGVHWLLAQWDPGGYESWRRPT
jgi:hypothetical protein